MTELEQNFKDVVESILDELNIDYATYDSSEEFGPELHFCIEGFNVYLELGNYPFSDYNIDIFTSTRDEIKSAVIEMNNEVLDKLREYRNEINSILNKWE